MKLVKTLSLFLFVAFVISGCEKEDIKKQLPGCLIIPSTSVPQDVITGFNLKFDGLTPEVWFDREGTGFAAVLTLDELKTIIYLSPDGKIEKVYSPEKESGNEDDDKSQRDCQEKGSHDKGSHDRGKGSHDWDKKKGFHIRKDKKQKKQSEKCICDLKSIPTKGTLSEKEKAQIPKVSE